MTAIVVGCLCAHMLRFGDLNLPSSYRITLILGLLLAIIVFPRFHLYESWRGRNQMEQIRSLTLAWITVGAGLIFLAFAIHISDELSRLWFGYWGIFSGLLLVCGRLFVVFITQHLRSRGHNSRAIAIVGTGQTARDITAHVQKSDWSGLRVVCIFGDESDGLERNAFDPSIEVCNTRDEQLEHELSRRRIDEVWICLPFTEQEKIDRTLNALRQSTVTQRLIPDMAGMKVIQYPVAEILGVPMLNVSATPIQGISRLVKGGEDKVLAVLFMLAASPLLLLIALAIKFSSRGPVLFKQRRHGANGKPIKVYKFRTMVVHKESDGGITQARKNDDRITSVGAFLRRTSLDELPQLLNVLQGRMSLVGPRPHAMEHNEFYKDKIETYMQRHKIKPGITGWAQINGWRGETTTLEKMQQRVKCDMYYIEHWSFWFDLKIIFLTIFRGFSSKNAY